jgi:hypothetical protein
VEERCREANIQLLWQQKVHQARGKANPPERSFLIELYDDSEGALYFVIRSAKKGLR